MTLQRSVLPKTAAAIGFILVLPAVGQTPSPSTYTPPTGEQPTYGKRYAPGQADSSFVIEINAAQLANKGFGIEFESRGSESMNLGVDLLFSQREVTDESGASGETQAVFIAPKIRLYPTQTLSGVFLGGKLFLGQAKSAVSVGGSESEKTFNLMSPTVHVGYRFLTNFGFTWSFYAGAGVNFPQAKFEEKHLKPGLADKAGVKSVITQLNDLNKVTRFDLGLTLGVAL